jgi:hypothetical protein
VQMCGCVIAGANTSKLPIQLGKENDWQ